MIGRLCKRLYNQHRQLQQDKENHENEQAIQVVIQDSLQRCILQWERMLGIQVDKTADIGGCPPCQKAAYKERQYAQQL